MDQSQMLPATASNPQRLHGGLYGQQYDGLGHDDAVGYDVFDAASHERILLGKAGKAHVLPEVFGNDARQKYVRNNRRFAQVDAHCLPPKPLALGQAHAYRTASSSVVSERNTVSVPYGYGFVNSNSAGKASEQMFPSTGHVSPPVRTRYTGSGSANIGGKDVTHGRKLNTIKDGPNEGDTSLAAREGEKPLHLIAPVAQSLAQIADQSPRHAIGQDNTRHDPMFFRMCDPGNQPDIAVDRLDVDTSGESIRDNERFGQRRVFFVISHRSSQVGAS